MNRQLIFGIRAHGLPGPMGLRCHQVGSVRPANSDSVSFGGIESYILQFSARIISRKRREDIHVVELLLVFRGKHF